MSLLYASVNLCDPTAGAFPEIETWAEYCESNLSLSRVFPLWSKLVWPTLRQSHIAWPGFEPEETVRLNTLIWPTGASRWAQFHGIVNEEQLKQIRTNTGGAPGPASLEMSWYDDKDQLVDRITPSMYMLAARPLDQLILGGDEADSGFISHGLYLLSLVDARYFWWYKSTAVITVTEGTTTWSQLFTSLGTAIGAAITVDSVASAYLKPSASLTAQYEFTPPMLDAVAYNVGQRIVRALDGTVKSQSASSASTALTANLALPAARSRRGGGKYAYDPAKTPNDLNAMAPATVRVLYPKADCGLLTGEWYTSSTKTLAALALAEFGTATGVAGIEKTFHCSCTADFTGGSGPVNSTELAALTTQIATDYYRFAPQAVDVKYTGIVSFASEAQSDRIEWAYREGDVSSRILPTPTNDLVADLLHASSANSPTKSGLIGYYGDWAFPGNLHMDAKRSWKPTDVSLSSDQNDYAAPTTPYLRVNATSDFKFTGFSGGNEGLVFLLTNKGTAIITLAHQNTSSSANNRLTIVGAQDDTLNPNESALIIYDCIAHTWYVNKYNAKVESVSTATIASDQNNYPAWKTQVLSATVTADVNITGIAPTQNVPGSLLEFLNNSTTGKIATMKHESASSTAANRINTPYGYDIKVPPKSIVTLKYNSSTSRWNPVAQYCCGGQLVLAGKTIQVASTVTWSSNQDNYAYPDNTYLQANVSSSMNLTGIVGATDSTGARIDGQEVEIQNVGTGTLTVKNETTSTAGNQIKTVDATDISVPPRGVIKLKYNLSAQRWYPTTMTGTTGGGSGGSSISVEDYPLGSTYTGITKIQFDSLQGLSASNPSAGVALVLGSADIGCKLTAAGPQNIGSGADAKLTWDSAIWDTHTFWSGGDPTKITFASAFNGVYLVIYRTTLTVSFGSVNTNQVPAVDVRLNGGGSGELGSSDLHTLFKLHYRSDGGAGTTDFEHGGCVLGCAFMLRISNYATDYIEVNANPGAANGGDFAGSTFSVQKLNASGVFQNLF